MTGQIVHVRSMLKTILNCHGWSEWVSFVTKTRDDNDMIDRIGTIYAENDTKLLWPIRLGVDFYENQIRQQCD